MVNLRERLSESYPAVVESVPAARKAVADIAAAAGATADQLDSIRLAVSEALTNVVVHAYAGREGNIHVSAHLASDELWVLVADDGTGLRPRLDSPGLGLGFALIVNSADGLEIANRSSGGTELRMRFRLRSDQPRGSESSTSAPASSSSFSTTT
jgi:serine/threonine-protein kinase RsbW